jgi:hypothetical protein
LAKALKALFSQAPPAQPQVRVNAMQLRVTLTINNDVVIDDVMCSRPGRKPLPVALQRVSLTYIPFPRALTGQDTILLRVTNSSGVANFERNVVYYKNEIDNFGEIEPKGRA